MKYLIGIDIGTSSAKCIVINPDGEVSALSSREYKIDTPRPGWAEQNPEVWWRATVECLRECTARSGAGSKDIAAISFSGQMHGSAFIDKKGRPLRPAIIWADQRSAPQCERIKSIVGADGLMELTGNSPSPGFMASSVVWVKENEPEVFRQTAKVLLPKDYIRYLLTGQISSEVSDASSTLLFDVKNRSWSWKLMKLLDLPESILPEVHESQEVSGHLAKEAAAELGLAQGTPVVAGGGDQAMAAVGNGVVKPGKALLTIGTGGQLFAVMDEPAFDPGFRVHTFCHALPQKWHLLGAMLSAGLSLKWFRDQIVGPLAGLSYTELSKMAESAPPGSEGLIFLPYLIGERTPHLDPKATGVFFGLTLRHGLGHLIRGICLAFRVKRYQTEGQARA